MDPGTAPLKIGDASSRTVLLTAEDVRGFATLCGDPNPLHHDEERARASRFGGLIASGGHLTALLTGACAGFTVPHGPGVGLEFTYQLRKAARAGQVLHLRWEVVGKELSPKLGGELLRLRGEIRGEDGALLVAGSGTVLSRDAF